MIVSIKEYKDRIRGVEHHKDGVCYRIETSGGKWVITADCITIRNLHGYPLIFDMMWDAECYLRNILGVK